MTRETSRNISLSGADQTEKQEAFKACADPAENFRQIAMIGDMIERDIFLAYETAKLTPEQALSTPEGKELAAAVGPTVFLTHRDQFFIEKVTDRYTCNFGDPIYFMRSKDCPMGVITASMTDGGSSMAVNTLQTMKGYDVPVPVAGQRFVETFEYDDPRLAMSNWSSRAKAVDMARYRARKAFQDMIIAALVGGFTTTFAAGIMHDLPAGRVHPVGNIIDCKASGKLDLDAIKKFGNYGDVFGFPGQKLLFVSPTRFNNLKDWVAVDKFTDVGSVFAKQLLGMGGATDSITIHDVTIVKVNCVPDNEGWGLIVDDGISRTLGVYQWGKIQTVPSNVNKPLRAAFDLYIPGVCGVNHDQIRCAKLLFA